MDNPFFSIITASYNSERTIFDTISSVLNQNFSDYEYVIIDGNSSDSTLDIIKSFEKSFAQKNIKYTYISEKDKGIYDAWNKGVHTSSGSWISFLGSDDEYYPDALENYFHHIQENPNSNYISSRVELINSKKAVLTVFGKPFVWKKVVRNMEVAQVGSFHKKELFAQVGLFSDEYKIVGDLEFYTRCKEYIKPAFFNKITAKMMNEGVSNQIYTALKEALEVKLKYKSNPAFIAYFDFSTILLKCYYNKLIKKK